MDSIDPIDPTILQEVASGIAMVPLQKEIGLQSHFTHQCCYWKGNHSSFAAHPMIPAFLFSRSCVGGYQTHRRRCGTVGVAGAPSALAPWLSSIIFHPTIDTENIRIHITMNIP